MSIRAKIAETAVRSMNMKKIFDLPEEQLLEKVKEMNKKRGGNIFDFDNGDVNYAKKIADKRNVEVWFPCYPLVIDHSVRDIVEMVHATYIKMLESYSNEEITIMGFSSGGAQALILCEYINEMKKDVPLPRQIIAVSPGTCSTDEEIVERMKELDKKDIMIPYSYFAEASHLMTRFDNDIPDYMVCAEKGNLSGTPMIHFIYGSDETLYATAPAFEKICKEQQVPYTMTIGKGMFHC